MNKLQDIIKQTIEGMHYEFVGLEQLASVLRIYIDREGGVTLDDCVEVSRQLGAVLDVEDLIKERYQLEVSSPGLDRPLFTLEDFERFVGHMAKVTLKVPLDGRSHFRGIIDSVQEEKVNLVVDGESFILPFAMIAKAKLVVTN